MKTYEILKWVLYSVFAFLLLMTAGLPVRLSIGLCFIIGEFIGVLNAIHSDLMDLKKEKKEE